MSSIDLLQVKKLKEHVYTKILKLDQLSPNDTNAQGLNDTNNNNYKSNENSQSSTNSNTNNQQTNSSTSNSNEVDNAIDIPLVANRTIELICSDQVKIGKE